MAGFGFFNKPLNGEAKGKTLEALQASKEGRQEWIRYFGGVQNLPSSVMQLGHFRDVVAEFDGLADVRGYQNSAPQAAYSKHPLLPRVLREAYRLSGQGCSSRALSAFPQNVGRSILLLYTQKGEVVFDPFAGHNSRMDLCVKERRHYVGCDLSTEFMDFNRKRADVLRQRYPGVNIDLHQCDSRRVPVQSRSADFTITSPPYYDIEYYGDEPEQLGKEKTYEDFLDGIGLVLKQNYRVLKWGAYAVWFVNDFRRKRRFHLYHLDVVRQAESVGFVPHDILIVDFGKSFKDCFTNQMMRTRLLPKRHEYGLVFRKPEKR